MKTPSKAPVTKTILPALKAAGVRIFISHSRAFGDGETTIIRQYPRRVNKTGLPILPYGGETVVNLSFPGDAMYTGVATCSPQDRFDRKLGISIALHRALAARKEYQRSVKSSVIMGCDTPDFSS